MNNKNPASAKERVEIWNTLFSYAYTVAAEMKGISTAWKSNVGKLSDEDGLKLRLLIFLNLAAEARSSHLILERVGKNITEEQGRILLHLNFRQQWKMLPALYQVQKDSSINYKKERCFYIIDELYKVRNKIFHAKHNEIRSYLNDHSQEQLIRYVIDFWKAMEYMNALLDRGDRDGKPNQIILDMVKPLRDC